MLVRFTVVKIQSPVENVHNCKKKNSTRVNWWSLYVHTGFLLVYIPSYPLGILLSRLLLYSLLKTKNSNPQHHILE